ncbi:hypothetical protein D3C84_1034590 [compost metagenome]
MNQVDQRVLNALQVVVVVLPELRWQCVGPTFGKPELLEEGVYAHQGLNQLLTAAGPDRLWGS